MTKKNKIADVKLVIRGPWVMFRGHEMCRQGVSRAGLNGRRTWIMLGGYENCRRGVSRAGLNVRRTWIMLGGHEKCRRSISRAALNGRRTRIIVRFESNIVIASCNKRCNRCYKGDIKMVYKKWLSPCFCTFSL